RHRDVEAGDAVGGVVDRIAASFEEFADGLRNSAVVLDQEDQARLIVALSHVRPRLRRLPTANPTDTRVLVKREDTPFGGAGATGQLLCPLSRGAGEGWGEGNLEEALNRLAL